MTYISSYDSMYGGWYPIWYPIWNSSFSLTLHYPTAVAVGQPTSQGDDSQMSIKAYGRSEMLGLHEFLFNHLGTGNMRYLGQSHELAKFICAPEDYYAVEVYKTKEDYARRTLERPAGEPTAYASAVATSVPEPTVNVDVAKIVDSITAVQADIDGEFTTAQQKINKMRADAATFETTLAAWYTQIGALLASGEIVSDERWNLNWADKNKSESLPQKPYRDQRKYDGVDRLLARDKAAALKPFEDALELLSLVVDKTLTANVANFVELALTKPRTSDQIVNDVVQDYDNRS